MEEFAIELKQITKKFGKTVANDHVDLKVKKGTIHGLLGENGSGKSTLMKVFFGLHKKDEGQTLLYGKNVEINSTLDAIRLGIGMIQQEFMLLPNLSVRENLYASIWNKNAKVKRKDLLGLADSKILNKLNLENVLDTPVKELSVGEQQKVEIAKTLYQGAEIIILDEPTSVLTPQESVQLFEILKKLRNEGKTIVLITHKLDEVLNYCSEVTVLRGGKKAAAFETKDVDKYGLAEQMVGKKILFKVNDKLPVTDEVFIELNEIGLKNRAGQKKLDNITFAVRKGEILGIAGIDGNGQKELSDVLSGIKAPTTGTYSIAGEKITKFHARDLKERGVAFIPEERNNLGAINGLSIEKNLILKNYYTDKFSRKGILNEQAIEENAKKCIEQYGIKAEDGKLKAGSLSGGNLQKVILARELSANPSVLICAQPTRGLDIGATETVQNMLIDARNSGISIVLISTELDEIVTLSDRIAIIYEGKIIDILENDKKLDLGQIGLMMAGGKNPYNFIAGGASI